jgi:tRNA(fMet)-specific endonuclease VapC
VASVVIHARYLLDTNVVSDLVRNPKGRVAQRATAAGDAALCTSIIVACELRYGAEQKGSPRLTNQLAAVLEQIDILPLDREADLHYGTIRAELERTGRMIGPNDLLIAAQCLALGTVLVTENEDEFKRVPGLRWENWVR